MSTSRARSALLATLGLSLACAPRTLVYLPDTGVTPTNVGPGRFTLTEVQTPASTTGLGVVLQVDATTDLAITAAHATPAAAKPCAGSDAPGAVAVAVMSLDGQRQWQRPLRLSGHHALTLEFPIPSADELDEEEGFAPLEAVDVTFTDGTGGSHCARLPLRTPQGGWMRRGPWSWGRGVRLDSPFLDAFTGVVRLGRWLGPLRLGGELGASARRCPDCLSALYVAAPAALTLEVVAATRSGKGLGLELAYAVRPILGAEAGDRYLLHGPRVTLRFVAAAPRTFGLPGGPQHRFTSFDLILARSNAAGIEHWAQTVFSVGWTWDGGF